MTWSGVEQHHHLEGSGRYEDLYVLSGLLQLMVNLQMNHLQTVLSSTAQLSYFKLKIVAFFIESIHIMIFLFPLPSVFLQHYFHFQQILPAYGVPKGCQPPEII